MPDPTIRILETPEEMTEVEALQRLVWPGNDTEVVPAHLLLTAAHNGGLVLGAYIEERLAGVLFGFPGLYELPDGPQPKHCSHLLGVHPNLRDGGIGFALKRAQWQLVRKQSLGLITWTYDPLLSRNAYLNLTRLGAVCNTYRRNEYGEMRDDLNAGLPSDRFQVDWWVNTKRVERRLGHRPRGALDLGHYEAANIQALYRVGTSPDGWPQPPQQFSTPEESLALVEIPTDFLALKAADLHLARDWRALTREVFEACFRAGYLATDFIFERSAPARGLYVLTYGESTLDMPTVRKK